METSFIIAVILLALIFDFINGFHDAANSIATIVSTKVLTPFLAVLWAAFFNFIAFLFFHLSVANTIGEGLIQPHIVTPYLIFAALSAAIVWNLVTWFFGLPSSSSHALMGGLVGSALLKGGWAVLEYSGLMKILIAIIVSPILGLLLAAGLMWSLKKINFLFNVTMIEKIFAKIQLFSAALLSLAHGGNDAQKTMGVIAVLLFSTHWLTGPFYVPFGVVIACNLVMALGTLAGGWKIVRTLGYKITRFNTQGGASAETGAAATILLATHLGIPISTTHTITGAVTGVGLVTEFAQHPWRVLQRITLAWVVTLPATALLAGFLMLLPQLISYLKHIV